MTRRRTPKKLERAPERKPLEGRLEATDERTIHEELREAGLRATHARVAVLALLRAADHALTHQQVVDSLEGERWDRATLYRNLITLVEAGFARRTDLGDHVWRFEAFDEEGLSTHEHPHFLCTECGEVECIPNLEIAVPRGSRVPRAIKDHSFEVQLKGLCDNCR